LRRERSGTDTKKSWINDARKRKKRYQKCPDESKGDIIFSKNRDLFKTDYFEDK
jgi:hypothetical protein